MKKIKATLPRQRSRWLMREAHPHGPNGHPVLFAPSRGPKGILRHLFPFIRASVVAGLCA